PPPVQYADGGYISGAALARAQAQGRQLIGPAQSPASLEGGRFTTEAFDIHVEERRAVCPAGHPSTLCSRMTNKKNGEVKYRFGWSAPCAGCALRAQCLQPKQRRRRLEVGEHHSLVQARRREQKTESFQEDYHRRNGIEGTISELKRGHGLGKARYRGLAKTGLQNYFTGAACNVKRWINRVRWTLQQAARSAPTQVPSG
ncbi:MAG TPA: transposase, partial [Candidatus Sulfotelmatobacter sp.]|nr:transposase [Candidatus Sulfotelmatobacter sp.]